jgi:hypothetical protein
VEGPVSVIGCTTKEKIYEDNANRAILIYLDDSKEQDERIMKYQKQLRAGLVDSYTEKLLQEKLQYMQSVLEPIKVVNPFAPLIEIPKEVFKPRRALPLLLSFIEAVTFYHQYQREQKADKKTGEVFIEVHPEDVDKAIRLMQDVLFRKADELSGAAREFYQWIGSPDRQFTDPNLNKAKGFYARDVRTESRIHPRTLNRYLNELSEYGLLQITGGNKNTTGYSYKLLKKQSIETLQKSITNQLDKVIETVWKSYETGKKPRKTASTVKKKQDTKTAVGQ